MSQLEVSCTVSNCQHWAEGERCSAEEILITTDRIGQMHPQSTDAAAVVRQHGPTEADASTETCCQTFTARAGGHPPQATQKAQGKGQELAGRH